MRTTNINGIFAEHYLLKEPVSSGNFAEVWKAEDWTVDGAIVAVKIFTPNIQLDNYILEQLRSEQEELSSLDHPHLLQPYKFDIYEGVPYLVMPYLAKGSLRQKLLETGPLPEEEIALLLTQVSSALDYLHTCQPPVLHKHISPDNILIADDDSYILSAPEVSTKVRNAMYKATGNPYTPVTDYAAPELFSAHPVYNTASDIFSLGVILYELCTGQVPWLGNGGISLLKGADVPYLPGPYSRILSNLVRSCMHPNWEKRPTAKLLTEEADYFVKFGKWKTYGSFGNVTAESIVYKKRSPLIPVLLASLLVLAALVASYFYFFNGKLPDNIVAIVTSTTRSPGQAATDTTVADSTRTTKLTTTQATTQKPDTQSSAPAPVIKKPAVTRQEPAKPTPTQQTASDKKPVAKQQIVYPRPANLEAYLNGMLNEEIPLDVKDKWKPTIRKYFTPDAIVYADLNESPMGSFGVAEFLDILISTENASIRIDTTIRNEEADKIEELNVSLTVLE